MLIKIQLQESTFQEKKVLRSEKNIEQFLVSMLKKKKKIRIVKSSQCMTFAYLLFEKYIYT